MPTLGSSSWVMEPLVALGCVGALVLLLRWAFGHGSSLVRRIPPDGGFREGGGSEDYGLLVRVAAPATVVEAQLIRLRLERAGLRATLATTGHGPGVLVFAEDAATARRLLDDAA